VRNDAGDLRLLSTGANGIFIASSTGNVGIGTSTPRGPLQIGTGDGDKIFFAENGGIAGTKIAHLSGWGFGMYTGRSSQNDGGYFSFNTSAASGYTERLRINSTGFVGIGTASPVVQTSIFQSGNGSSSATVKYNFGLQLHNTVVGGSDNRSNLILFTDANSTQSTIGGYRNSYNNHFLGGLMFLVGSQPAGYTQATPANGTQASVSLTEAMRITPQGNVVISTASSGYTLDVAGTIHVVNNGWGAIRLEGNTTDVNMSIKNTGTNGREFLIGCGSNGSSAGNGYYVYDSTAGVFRMVIGSTGNLGVGVNSPAYTLDVAGTIRTSSALAVISSGASWDHGQISHDGSSLNIDAGGAELGMAFRITNSNAGYPATYTERMRIDVNGNVGIGTASPSTPLHIETNVTSGGTSVAILASGITDPNFKLVSKRGVTSNNTNDIMVKLGMVYNSPAVDNAYIRFHRGSSTSGGSISLSTGNDNERMRIDGSGNVGIGTTSPGYTLDVNGTARVSATGTGFPAQFITSNSSGQSNVVFVGSSSVNNITNLAIGTGQSSYNAGELHFYSFGNSNASNFLGLGVWGNARVLNILGNGYVGIGTSSPFCKFTVQGDSSGRTGAAGDPTQLQINGNSDTNKKLCIGVDTTNNYAYIQSVHEGTAYRNIVLNKDGGNVGIGTSNPTYLLDVNGAALLRNGNQGTVFANSQLLFGYQTTAQYMHSIRTRHNSGANNSTNAMDFFVWQTSDSSTAIGSKQVMSVTSSGIGIGTNSPSYPLHVNGNVGQSGAGGNFFLTGTNLIQGSANIVTNISLYCSDGIMSGGMLASVSDARTKTDVLELSGQTSLDVLRALKPCTFQFIDPTKNAHEKTYGFIAQEVEQILPEAVVQSKDFIPSIMQKTTVQSNSVTVSGSVPEQLEAGCHLRIYASKSSPIDVVVTSVSSTDSDYTITFEESDELNESEQVFVYGHQVGDCRSVVINAISTVVTKSVQELDAQVQSLQAEIAQLKSLVQTLLPASSI
jgi:hypothetical protein